MPLASDGILMGMSRTFKTVNYEQALDLTVRLATVCRQTIWRALW